MRSTTLVDLIYDTPLMKESRKRKVKKRASGPSGGSISGPLAVQLECMEPGLFSLTVPIKKFNGNGVTDNFRNFSDIRMRSSGSSKNKQTVGFPGSPKLWK